MKKKDNQFPTNVVVRHFAQYKGTVLVTMATSVITCVCIGVLDKITGISGSPYLTVLFLVIVVNVIILSYMATSIWDKEVIKVLTNRIVGLEKENAKLYDDISVASKGALVRVLDSALTGSKTEIQEPSK